MTNLKNRTTDVWKLCVVSYPGQTGSQAWSAVRKTDVWQTVLGSPSVETRKPAREVTATVRPPILDEFLQHRDTKIILVQNNKTVCDGLHSLKSELEMLFFKSILAFLSLKSAYNVSQGFFLYIIVIYTFTLPLIFKTDSFEFIWILISVLYPLMC